MGFLPVYLTDLELSRLRPPAVANDYVAISSCLPCSIKLMVVVCQIRCSVVNLAWGILLAECHCGLNGCTLGESAMPSPDHIGIPPLGPVWLTV